MCKKLIYLISFVLMLGSVGNAATVHWTGRGGNNLWSNPSNWEFNSVPTSGDEVYIDVPAAEAPNGPLIRDGIAAKAFGLACEVAGEPMMTMTGGTFAITDWVWWGDGAGSHGTFYMSGGTITVGGEFELGWGGGTGTWIMTGGTVTANELIIPTSSGVAGQLYLHGGTFNVGMQGLRMTQTGLIDVGAGMLVFEGDLTTTINDFIAAGQITAYGGVGTVSVTYDGRTTTVVAIGAPVATNPNPADGQKYVPRDVVLSWTPGFYVPPTNGHKVYFSENFNEVNDGIGGITQDVNSYTPAQRLDLGTTYYWRVDEVNNVNPDSPWIGDVWSFTTEPVGYPVENITATASSMHQADMGPENTISGLGLDDNDLHSMESTAMWLSSNELNGAWIEYEFDKAYKLHQMWVWNSNQIVEPLVGFGFRDVTIEHSTNGTDWTTLGTTVEFAKAPGADGYAHNTTVDFGGAVVKYVRLTANSNWGGMMPQYGLSEVRFLYIPIRAREPSPDSGAADVDLDVTLGWNTGREAAQHDVYFNSDEQAVIDGTAPVTIATETSYGPLALDLGVTYYWKINEVNEAETPTTLEGDLWNFTTREFLVVDDFESYNNFDITDPNSNRIFLTWIDGYEQLSNGSVVGYAEPPFAEQGIVHSGMQSMPLSYNNTGGATYSEAERTFAVAQNWTEARAATLVLYFQGAEGNTGQLYVKVNNSKVVYDGDAADIAKPQWTQWNIDLASVGVSLQNITKLSIGIDGSGASGTLYVDDIRLYQSAP
ncbi:MAG: discoidin domain-containing protein [Planctomycetota bacterium]|jgi:hypothetical protein